MKRFTKYVLPAILIFLGGLIGVYLTSKFNHNDWKERTQYEQDLKIFGQKLDLIERTTTVTGKMPSTNDLFNIYLSNYVDTSTHNKLNKEQQISLSEKLGDIRAELRSVMFLNQIYFGDSTKAKIQKYLITDKKNTWWSIPDSTYNDIVQTMAKELNTSTTTKISQSDSPKDIYNGYLWLFLWLASLTIFWTLTRKLSSSIENQARYFLAYVLSTGCFLIIFKGTNLGIPDEYLSNLTTEIIGIAITVFLIDRIYNYISSKNEALLRKLALKTCRMPIYTYCKNWFYIFESDNKALDAELQKYEDLNSFFKSDDFYNRVRSFDFNKKIAEDKTYAQYYHEKIIEINDKFQSVLAKYASKLSHKDIQLLEHFGGRAYIFTIFAVMKFISETKFTSQRENEPAKTVMPFNNSFKDVKRENFNKHFDKLIELITEYNGAVDNDYQKWTIENIAKLHTPQSANSDPKIEW
jgi:hypothetical protein